MPDLWIFVPACFAINLAFGPNNLMAMTNAAQQGVAFSASASAGRLLAFAPMILASALGLGVILATSALVFGIAKAVGAAYLIYLGVKLLRSGAPEGRIGQERALSMQSAFRREFLVALSNPKAILTFAAFLPQFVSMDRYWSDYALVAVIFLGLEFLAILAYGLLGRFAARGAGLGPERLGPERLGFVQKISGVTMIVFGAGLLLARRPEGV